MSQNEYPLSWPQGWPRTSSRKSANFKSYGNRITYSGAEARARDELRMMGYDQSRGGSADVIVSSNVLRDREPKDPYQRSHAPELIENK